MVLNALNSLNLVEVVENKLEKLFVWGKRVRGVDLKIFEKVQMIKLFKLFTIDHGLVGSH